MKDKKEDKKLKEKKPNFYQTKIGRKILKVFFIGVIISLIYIAYSMGTTYGLMIGISAAQGTHNETICDFIGHERAADGFCILNDEGPREYRWYMDCGWEKFKIEGEKKPTFLLRLKHDIFRILMYPITRC